MIEIGNDEKIIRIVRKHWFVLLGDVFFVLVALSLPVFALFLLGAAPFNFLFTFTGSTTAFIGFLLFSWLLVIWMVAWHLWTDYYLDVLIISNKRIFDIEQKGLFSRLSSSFRIDRIQNITVDQRGIIQTLLDFGTLRMETAGEREDFIANYIARPYEIKKFLNALQDTAIEQTQVVQIGRETLEKLVKGKNSSEREAE